MPHYIPDKKISSRVQNIQGWNSHLTELEQPDGPSFDVEHWLQTPEAKNANAKLRTSVKYGELYVIHHVSFNAMNNARIIIMNHIMIIVNEW